MNQEFIQITNNPSIDLTILLIVFIWVMVWKGAALWVAAKKDSKKWFIALLILNTLGILEILYIYIFSRNKTITENSSTNQSDLV